MCTITEKLFDIKKMMESSAASKSSMGEASATHNLILLHPKINPTDIKANGLLFSEQSIRKFVKYHVSNPQVVKLRKKAIDSKELLESETVRSILYLGTDIFAIYRNLSIGKASGYLGAKGDSKYGYVKLGQNLKTKEWVAIKIINNPFQEIDYEAIDDCDDHDEVENEVDMKVSNETLAIDKKILTEISTLKELGLLKGYGCSNNKMYIAQTLFIGDTLNNYVFGAKFLNFSSNFQEQAIKHLIVISINLMKSLELLHRKGIIHRDLHGDNIIIEHSQLKANIVDFGSSLKMSELENPGMGKRDLFQENMKCVMLILKILENPFESFNRNPSVRQNLIKYKHILDSVLKIVVMFRSSPYGFDSLVPYINVLTDAFNREFNKTTSATGNSNISLPKFDVKMELELKKMHNFIQMQSSLNHFEFAKMLYNSYIENIDGNGSKRSELIKKLNTDIEDYFQNEIRYCQSRDCSEEDIREQETSLMAMIDARKSYYVLPNTLLGDDEQLQKDVIKMMGACKALETYRTVLYKYENYNDEHFNEMNTECNKAGF